MLCVDEKSHTDYGYVTKIAIVEKWRWLYMTDHVSFGVAHALYHMTP